ncbi:MAG TPA: response regulator transcription factor [Acidimicrobiales bacterium]|nr:response regulator transcription factor [Acidimicrobiales bacterium]
MESGAVSALIVDDAEDMRLLLRRVLERADITIVGEAVDGLDALRAVAELGPPPVPTVIVLDNMMPNLNGLEAAEQLLRDDPTLRIVLFTAYLSDEVSQRAAELGIRAAVSKSDLFNLAPLILDVAGAA